MPVYEYYCKACGEIFQENRSINETKRLQKCPLDGGKLLQKYGVAVTFKGDGFYANDKKKAKGE